MSVCDDLLMEFREELKTTRRVLDRVPADKLAWKPHDKSRTLGELAMHIATVPAGIAAITAGDSFDVLQGNFAPPQPKATDEIHSALDQTARDVEKTLNDDERRTGLRAMAIDARGCRDLRHSARRGLENADAEPLVPPSRPALGLSASLGGASSFHLRPQRR